MTRYLFIVGGVMSGIGKGITASAIARNLKDRGLIVAPVKIDPYINVDAGTMNPFEHGEIFVTEDGAECDQDIGNYERFLHETLSGKHSITTGQIYQAVIHRERNLEYGGRCVETVPDIPNEVIRRLRLLARQKSADILLVEIGGTVGEYQNLVYLEAARLMRLAHPDSVAIALVSYLPIPHALGEMKTKPTQQAVRMLQEAGLQPNFIIARGSRALDRLRKKKLAIFCNVPEEHIISAPDAKSIYEIPRLFDSERLSDRVLSLLNIRRSAQKRFRSARREYAAWNRLLQNIASSQKSLRIGIVGKYVAAGDFVLRDAYISIIEAIKHAAWTHHRQTEIVWVDAETLERGARAASALSQLHGIIVPGGFGKRGVEGKIRAIRFARERRIPYLGLCYGMQLAVVEFARNVAGLRHAHTTEIDSKTPHPVIDILPEQRENVASKKLGGTMRLGAQPCAIAQGTLAATAYKKAVVSERHRHRYELNNNYRDTLAARGLVISGVHPKRGLAEIVELPRKKHPFFLGTQFHPELQSRPLAPHPLFTVFVAAAKNRSV